MVHKRWFHKCKELGEVGLRVEVCPHCGKRGRFDGWSPSMVEAWCDYQRRTGMKVLGPHRPLTDKLLEPHVSNCSRCGGGGIVRTRGTRCPTCKGVGYVADCSQEELEMIRRKILAKYPNASAPQWGTKVLKPARAAVKRERKIKRDKEPQISVSRPKDLSLAAYKGWVRGIAKSLNPHAKDDVTDAEWEADWKVYVAEVKKDRAKRAPSSGKRVKPAKRG